MAPSRGSLSTAVIRPMLQTEDPPPSTLAAQIVNSLSKRKDHSKHQDQESFTQLLREILDAGDENDRQSDSIETNVEVNHKIIYVVVKSGIEVLFRDDPFNKKADLVKQGLSSLAVIGLTIRRSPEVLFFRINGYEPDPKLGGPLFLWLVPAFLSILAWDGDREIHKSTLQVLRTILNIERKTHSRGFKPQSILKFVQGCVKGKPASYILSLCTSNEFLQDLLFFIEGSSPNHIRNLDSNQVVVPTLATISEICPANLEQYDLKQSQQVPIKTSFRALNIVLLLIAIVCSPCAYEDDKDIKAHVTVPDCAWILSCLTRIWNVIAPDGVLSISGEFPVDNLVIFLDTVRNASSRLAALKHESSTASRTFVLLARAIATVMLTKSAESSAILDKSVCLGLLELASISNCAPRSLQVFNEHILPVLLDIKDADDRFHIFGEDLQVGYDINHSRA